MAHVTFIHGIANKPPPDELLRIWRRALADGGDALPLGDLGVTSRMVYWADVLYAAPDADAAAHEGVLENSPEAIDGDAEVPVPATVERHEHETEWAVHERFLGKSGQRLGLWR